jgi:hypothetical protein
LLPLSFERIMWIRTEAMWGGREREERNLGVGVVRDTTVFGGGRVIGTAFGSLKVPRQCPLVLLVEARLVLGICSILNFKDVGAAVVGRNVV